MFIVLSILMAVILVVSLIAGVFSQASNATGDFYWKEASVASIVVFVVLFIVALLVLAIIGGIKSLVT